MTSPSQGLLRREHLEALAVTYPDDINVEPPVVLAAFDSFEMPIQHGIIVDSDYRKTDDELYPDINNCVFTGLSYVTFGVKDSGGPHRSYDRERAVKPHLEKASMKQVISRVRAEADLDEAARHFFTYGVALGISVRHERSIRDLFRVGQT